MTMLALPRSALYSEASQLTGPLTTTEIDGEPPSQVALVHAANACSTLIRAASKSMFCFGEPSPCTLTVTQLLAQESGSPVVKQPCASVAQTSLRGSQVVARQKATAPRATNSETSAQPSARTKRETRSLIRRFLGGSARAQGSGSGRPSRAPRCARSRAASV